MHKAKLVSSCHSLCRYEAQCLYRASPHRELPPSLYLVSSFIPLHFKTEIPNHSVSQGHYLNRLPSPPRTPCRRAAHATLRSLLNQLNNQVACILNNLNG